jgi:prevent-host-death family protein
VLRGEHHHEGEWKMRTVTATEARERMSLLLDFVEKGEEVVITRRGVPAARLLPASPQVAAGNLPGIEAALRVLEEINEMSKGVTLGGISIRELIDEGRR